MVVVMMAGTYDSGSNRGSTDGRCRAVNGGAMGYGTMSPTAVHFHGQTFERLLC